MNSLFVLAAIRQYKAVTLFCAIAGIALAFFYGAISQPQYKATAQLLVEMAPPAASGGAAVTADPVAGTNYLQAQLPTYVEYARSRKVIEPVIGQLNLGMSTEELDRHLEFSVPSDTVIVTVTAIWDSPLAAQKVANSVAKSFAQHVPGFESAGSADSSAQKVSVDVFSPATAPVAPEGHVGIRLAIGFVGGGAVGTIIALVLKLRDPYLRSAAEIEDITGAPLIGVLRGAGRRGRWLRFRGRNIVPKTAAGAPATAARTYTALYTALGLADSSNRPRVLTLVSSQGGAISGDVAWGVAEVAANSGLRTVVATGDREVHRYFDTRLSTMPYAAAAPEVIPAAAIDPPLAGVLSTAALDVALREVVATTDMVLIATASPVFDASARSYMDVSDRIVIVVQSGTTRHELEAIARSARESNGALFGVVVRERTNPLNDARSAASVPKLPVHARQ